MTVTTSSREIRGQSSIEQTFIPTSPDRYYQDPLKSIPTVEQPEIDVTFSELPAQQLKRAEALLALAALDIAERGFVSDNVEHWLAIARQNARDITEEQKKVPAAYIGLRALYLSSDYQLRNSVEAYVYTSRIMRAKREIDANIPFGSNLVNDYEVMLDEFDALDNEAVSFDTYLKHLTGGIDTVKGTPELSQSRSVALFNYASTMPDGPEKKSLLVESLVNANYAYSFAKDNPFIRGLSLQTMACTLNDISYIEAGFDNTTNSDHLADEARNYSVTLLQESIYELNNALKQYGSDEKIEAALDVSRYFERLYSYNIDIQEKYQPETDGIQEYIVHATEQKFGIAMIHLMEVKSQHQDIRNRSIAA